MDPLSDLVGESAGITAVRETIARLLQRHSEARRLPPILIQGETGTGKGLVARAIHRAGPRRHGPFVDVNCAAIPETLLEAEMFGFERGAFTDARQAKRGLFQAAHRGTLFLDEVGLLPETLQSKLLKAIEERAVRRLGSTKSEPVDVWILTATSENLAVATRERRFREDLYHRLAVLTIWLPPLRERGPDIVILAEHFLARASHDYDLPPKTLSAGARAALAGYAWPGNVREVGNVMERVALLSEEREVTADTLGLPAAGGDPSRRLQGDAVVPLGAAVGEVERAHLLDALRQTGWNISRAATRLGIPRNTLRYRIDKHGLRPEGGPAPRPRPARRTPAPAGAAQPPAPAGVASPPVAPTVVRWERRRVTVLRAALAAPPGDPDEADSSRALTLMVQKVQTFGGRVVELASRGIVAAFGLEPVEDAPRRAAHAAMAIAKAAERDWESEAAGVSVRGAVHVGQFMVGRLADAVEIDQDGKLLAWALLDTLITAAEPGAVLVSPAAAPFLERRFELVPVADDRAGERAYRLGRAERAGFERHRGRFVGRQDELELLQGLLASASRGQGQVVGIVGEPGIGKSRLLFEFRQGLTGPPVSYLEGHCLSYGSAIPYLPVLDILRASCGIAEADTPATAAAKLRAGLEQAALDAEEAAPYLLQLLGFRAGADRLASLSPEMVKIRTFESLRQITLEASRRCPLIVMVEDLHWVDRISEEYLASLVEVIAAAGVLLVATYRPGYRPPWLDKSYATQIALRPLAPEDSLRVVRAVLPADEAAGPLVEKILSKAEGNPFFLEELARAVREQHDLPAVPDTIEEVLLVRIDRLAAEDRRLLQSAAVIGKDVPLAILRAIAEEADDRLRQGLANLKAGEFLYDTSLGAEVGCTFKHALTHEVAYGSLGPVERRELHARIVSAIEDLRADRLDEHVEHLAHHAFQAEAWEKAVPYCRQAGARAFARSANREAVAGFEQALAALAHLPDSRERREWAIDLRFDLRNPLQLLGEFDRILDYLHEARALAETLDEPLRLGWVFSFMGQCFRLTGDLDRAIEAGERALVVATARGDFALRVATETHLGPAYAELGDYRRGIEVLRGSIGSLTGRLARDRYRLAGFPAVGSRSNLVAALAELGEFAEGMSLAAEAIGLAEAIDDPYSRTFAYFGAGTLRLLKGELEAAIAVLDQGLALCRAVNLPLMLPPVASSLGAAYALSGRLAEGLPLLTQAVEEATRMKLGNRYLLFLVQLGEGYLLAGRRADALEVGERACHLARAGRRRGSEAHALHLLARVAAIGEESEAPRAVALHEEALALADELGMRPLLARGHLELGGLYRRAGAPAEADRHLRRAVALFRELGMAYWLARGEAELTGPGR